MASCSKHPFEQAAGTCRICGDEFCADDLVYSHGPERPPFCIPCALDAAGVRKSAAPAKASTGRTRVGLLAVASGLVAMAVPVLSHLA